MIGTTLSLVAPDSGLSFATDLIHAMPECVCIYLAKPDIMIPNKRWKQEAGEVYRLTDLDHIGINSTVLRQEMEELNQSRHQIDMETSAGPLGLRRLMATEVEGQSGVYLLYLRDETEVRRVEQLRKDFIANVSHELRTPLTAVKGYIETLLDPKFLTMERVREFLPVIFEHTERLHNLMLDLLSLSRLENPNTHIERHPLNLAEQLREAVEATAPLARMKSVQVDVEAVPEDLLVLASAEHMERIMVNLLDNAFKYSPPDSKVRIWCDPKGDHIWVHVTDEGPGIGQEDQTRVFERFYRTRSALSGRARGTGLGLAIVKHIVQQLGGEIRVSSQLGTGSDFYFSLRLVSPTEQGQPVILGERAIEP